MSYRQKKKRDKKRQLLIICRSATGMRPEMAEEIRKNIERQLKEGSVILLPVYVRVEAVIKRNGSSSIEILEYGKTKTE